MCWMAFGSRGCRFPLLSILSLPPRDRPYLVQIVSRVRCPVPVAMASVCVPLVKVRACRSVHLVAGRERWYAIVRLRAVSTCVLRHVLLGRVALQCTNCSKRTVIWSTMPKLTRHFILKHHLTVCPLMYGVPPLIW